MAQGRSEKPMIALPFAVALVLFQGLAVLAVLLTGSWRSEPPGFLQSLDPLYTFMGGRSAPQIVPQALLDSLPGGQWCQGANFLAWAALQWLGLGLLVDLVRKRGS